MTNHCTASDPSFSPIQNTAELASAGTDALRKSMRERFFQALLFELIAVVLCATAGAWLLGYSLVHIGALTVMISTIAMLWNMLFNTLFDRAQLRLGFRRGLAARLVQAALFEIGLVAAIVPLAAWWLGISLWEALVLDIGIALFFLPYTFVYNWTYDTLRARVLARRSLQAGATSAAPRPTR
ncbi:MAG: hypothetical protein JWP29_1860 [Rhodoferax sp.]|nr:hypothetical protein [Rhodoferax sp.]